MHIQIWLIHKKEHHMIDMVHKKIEHHNIGHKDIIDKVIHNKINFNKYLEHFLVALCQEEDIVIKIIISNSILYILWSFTFNMGGMGGARQQQQQQQNGSSFSLIYLLVIIFVIYILPILIPK
jgi:hypothetical protein